LYEQVTMLTRFVIFER